MLRLRCRIKIKHEGEILVSIVKDSAFSFNNQFRIYKQFRIKTQFRVNQQFRTSKQLRINTQFGISKQLRINTQFRINKIVLNHRKQNHSKS